MAEQEVNIQYAYNSLLNRYMEAIKEVSYKDSLITGMQEELDSLRGEDEATDSDAEEGDE